MYSNTDIVHLFTITSSSVYLFSFYDDNCEEGEWVGCMLKKRITKRMCCIIFCICSFKVIAFIDLSNS